MGLNAQRVQMAGRLVLSALLVGTLVGFAGCDGSSSTSRKVSSSLFLAPVPDNNNVGGSTNTLVTQDDFLQANSPDALPADLADETIEAAVLENLSPFEILIRDTRSNTVFGLDIGPDFDDPECSHTLNDANGDGEPDCERVIMHYNQDGLAEALRSSQAILSPEVKPIRLANGWILAFEVTTRSIVAFRRIEPQLVAVPGGGELEIPYRSSRTSLSRNFGQGNGLLVSEVLTVDDLEDATGSEAVARFYEIEPNKVMLFFNGLGAIHLLEVTEEEELLDYNLELEDPQERDVFPTPLLKGSVKLFPRLTLDGPLNDAPFLTYQEIAVFTGDANLDLNDFDPVTIPSDQSALLFDANSFTFVRVLAARNGFDPGTGQPSDEITGAIVNPAVTAANLLAVIGGLPSDEMRMGDRFFNPDSGATELLVMEEETNNVIAYDYNAPISDNVGVFVEQAAIVAPRAQDGSTSTGLTTSAEPELIFSRDDVQDNRLAFDGGLGRLLSVSLSSSLLVVVLSRADLIAATGQSVADLTLVQPLNDNQVRAFDAFSASLLDIRLLYRALPVSQSN